MTAPEAAKNATSQALPTPPLSHSNSSQENLIKNTVIIGTWRLGYILLGRTFILCTLKAVITDPMFDVLKDQVLVLRKPTDSDVYKTLLFLLYEAR